MILTLLLLANLQTLRGGGLELTADFTGWTQDEGAGVFHGNYVRLGQFNGLGESVLSILVDDLPKGVTDIASLCEHAHKSYSDVQVLDSAPACIFTYPIPLHRRNFYAEMIVENRWLEFHYSAPDTDYNAPVARHRLKVIIDSMTVKRFDAPPNTTLQVDIQDRQVNVAESTQQCRASSKSFVCRALAAFKEGKRPSGRSTPVSFIGLSMMLAEAPDLPVIASVITLSDTELGQTHLEQENASRAVTNAVHAGKRPAETPALARAKSEIKMSPAMVADRSVVLPNTGNAHIVLRETSMGLIGFGFVPGGFILEVYPTQ